MRIAICNENKNYLWQLKQMIYSYAEKARIEMFVECFSCGRDLLSSKNKFHIVFLDYGVEKSRCLGIAKRLTEADFFCSIVFTGTKSNFDNSVFKVGPMGYIFYPIMEREVWYVLNNCFRKRKNGYPLLVKSGEDTVWINVNEIVYIEANNKHCILHLAGECIESSKTMANVYNALPKEFFLKINRSNIVNTEYINRFNSGEVILKNGERLHISRSYRRVFKDDFNNLIKAMIV